MTVGQTPEQVEAELLGLLQRSPRRAELVSRLLGTMRRRNAGREDVEQALAELERRPAILVREHYCADPHLDAADLRVAAVIEHQDDSEHDPIAEAAARIESVWQGWLGEYLSNHTCV